ncbi:uncharacterized protein [Eurosta solidaginis]|uniref:uncharacterized protein n=1 Tax=Eurosta solidaginis TaxID=178769 RepID=UPI003530D4C9
MSGTLARRLKTGILKAIETRVILGDGKPKTIIEAVDVEVRMSNQVLRNEMLILPGLVDEVVLGTDYLAKVNMEMRCGGQTLTLNTNNQEEDAVTCTTMVESRNESSHKDNSLKVANTDESVSKFLNKELQMFQEMSGVSNVATHKIVMKDDRPIKQRYYPKNPKMQEIINKEIDELIEKGCIEPSRSPHSAPIVLARKKNGKWRLWVDYRQLNARSVPDAYPLPRIQHILDRLRSARFISSLDLKNGYWQIPMEENSKQYTAFTVPGRGLYQWKVMPFGLHSAPATFQRALDHVIGPELEPYAFAYLDDIIITSKTLEEHIRHLAEVFQRLRGANLKINPEKCEFFKKSLKYLGHVVSEEGIHTDPDKIAAIKELTPPNNLRELRRFLGVVSWYRRFVSDFSQVSHPLTSMLKKGRKWKWSQEQQSAFEALKAALTQAPVLACPDFSKKFCLQTDASDFGLGAVLTQGSDSEERVIAYASRRLNKAETNYSPTEKECLAIVWAIRKMRPYLEGYTFTVITDHLALKWLNAIDSPTGRIARWALELQQYSFDVQYRKGKLNVVADALSRQPMDEQLATLTVEQGKDECKWLKAKITEVRKAPEKFPDYVIEDGKLYRRIESQVDGEDAVPWKLCVPTPQRRRVLAEIHDTPSAGHMGVRKSIARATTRYYWPGMFRDVRKYVQQCHGCQVYKPSQQQAAGKMLTKIPEEPWATVCADFVGPMPRSKHGNTMALVFVDRFSKWVEIMAIRKATTESVVRGFRERILARFGIPKVLITDNGAQFVSKRFKKYLEELGVKHQLTAPYTPQENPTERANRNIKRMIAQFSGIEQRTWDELIPEITLALNTSVCESTGYSPAYVVQGREPRIPNSLYDEHTFGTGERVANPAEKSMKMKEIFEMVRRKQERASAEQAKHYNLRRRQWRPAIGDLVLVKEHQLSKAVDNFAAKLAPRYSGPHRITNFVSPVIVELDKVFRGRRRTAHLSELKAYHATDAADNNESIKQRNEQGNKKNASEDQIPSTSSNRTTNNIPEVQQQRENSEVAICGTLTRVSEETERQHEEDQSPSQQLRVYKDAQVHNNTENQARTFPENQNADSNSLRLIIDKVSAIRASLLSLGSETEILRINLADPLFYKPQKIDVLISSEVFFDILRGEKVTLGNGLPFLVNTSLGWVVGGQCEQPITQPLTCNVVREVESVESLLRKFWEVEEITSLPPQLSEEEKACEEHFQSNIFVHSDGRLQVRLPFKESPAALGNSIDGARKRFFALERRLYLNPRLHQSYCEFMAEYQTLGHMTAVSDTQLDSLHYVIPHHCVLRPESTTTKLRVVFDASMRTSSNKALNEILMVGPTIQQELILTLLTCRLHRYALTADIVKMYRQFLVEENDRNFQLILWRETASAPLHLFQLNTVTYGMSSAPFLAIRCLAHLADMYGNRYPVGARVLREDLYVDDLLTGANSVKELLEIQDEITTLLAHAGLQLAKWNSNCPQLIEKSAEEIQIKVSDDNVTKALGMVWKPMRDEICFSFESNECSIATKRTILSTVAKIYDILGLLSPITIRCKILLQELWIQHMDWDEPLTQDLYSMWLQIKNDLNYINAGSVNQDDVKSFCAKVPYLIEGYDSRNIYNADETGLFFRALPDKTFALKGEECTGGKLAKDRLTILHCVNVAGEKERLFVIGKSARHRAFRNINLNNLPATWRSNKKAWMASDLMTDFLVQFDRKMQLQERNVVLFLDNAASHPRDLKLKNVKVIFLTANTTAFCQPLDEGNEISINDEDVENINTEMLPVFQESLAIYSEGEIENDIADKITFYEEDYLAIKKLTDFSLNHSYLRGVELLTDIQLHLQEIEIKGKTSQVKISDFFKLF